MAEPIRRARKVFVRFALSLIMLASAALAQLPSLTALANGQEKTLGFHIVQTKFEKSGGFINKALLASGAIMIKKGATSGVSLTYLGGLTAESDAVVSSSAQFQIPAAFVTGDKVVLLKLTPSAKYGRLIREESTKMSGKGALDVAEPQQIEVPASINNAGKNLVIVPSSPLEPGEYAVVVIDAVNRMTMAFDFKVQ